jgi:choline dehydrogenase-like flavoprotein
MEDYRALEANPGPKVKTDAEIDAYIRRTAMTAHHPSSTCRMGQDDNAALDPKMRVRGIEGLRVVDASSLPRVTSGNTAAPVYMLAERIADVLRGRLSL